MRDGHADSRCSSRYSAVKDAVFLGWWEEPEYRTTPAVLRNLSHGGASIQVGWPPPSGAELYLCLAGSPPSEWVDVERLEQKSLVDGQFEIRLKFPDSCPYEMFNAAVLGIAARAD